MSFAASLATSVLEVCFAIDPLDTRHKLLRMAADDKTIKPSVEEILQEARTVLASIKVCSETAKTLATEATESQKLTIATLADAKAKLDEITTAVTQAIAAKTKITDDQAVIATKSDHIQKAQEHADKIRADLDRELTAAKAQVTAAESLKSDAETASEKTAELIKEIQSSKESAAVDAAEILKAKETAEKSAIESKGLADKSAVVEERIATYEKRLAELDTLCTRQLKTIEDLLPGATAAGLASSFDERRESFKKPHNRWQWLFVGSVLSLVVLAISGLLHVYFAGTPLSYDELFRLWLSRLPVAAALVWLALHASHESALAKRLEEDYGYKAAIASCLMGFQKQISVVGKDAASNTSLAKLLDNTLTEIANSPGRIYDKHKLTTSPSAELTAAARAIVKIAGVAHPEDK